MLPPSGIQIPISHPLRCVVVSPTQLAKVRFVLRTASPRRFRDESLSFKHTQTKERSQALFTTNIRLEGIASELQTEIFENPSENRDEDALTALGYRAIARESFGDIVDEDNANWNMLYCRRIGIETCGELRAFFLSADIQSFYEQCQQSGLNSNPLVSLAESKQEFWIIIGSRLAQVKERFEMDLDSVATPSHNNEG